MILKFIQNMGGIGIFGVISICLFFAVFTGTLLWSWQLKKPFLRTMESLPLEDSPPVSSLKGDHSHE